MYKKANWLKGKIILTVLISVQSFQIVLGISPTVINQFNKLLKRENYVLAREFIEEYDLFGASALTYYKVGLCYYYSLDQKFKAIKYFEQASRLEYNLTSNCRFYDLEETNVPYEVFYYLGESYLYNNQVDMALYYFIKYTKYYHSKPLISIDDELNWCINTLKNINSPINIIASNIGTSINSTFNESSPVVSLDNSVIFFAVSTFDRVAPKDDQFYPFGLKETDIYYSFKDSEGYFSQKIPFEHNTAYDEHPVCLSADGRVLYLARKKKKDYDLFYSEYIDSSWTSPKSMGGSINSAKDDVFASITKDGNNFYLSSNRGNKNRGFDIFMAEQKKNGEWTRCKRIEGFVNTNSNEIYPFIHPTGRTLYYSTDGQPDDNMGGYDIFYAFSVSNKWYMPANIGYPLNTVRNDLGFSIATEGKRYKTEYTDFNGLDIYQISGEGLWTEEIDLSNLEFGLIPELSVMEILEIEKVVEKEVVVTEVMEIETETNLGTAEEQVIDDVDEEEFSIENMDFEALDSTLRESIIEQVKAYITKDLEENKSTIFKTIQFDFNSAELLILSKSELRILVEFMHENPDVKVEVIGHTDIIGNWDINLTVSRRRAFSVYRFLLENRIQYDRIIYYGKGSATPISDNTTEEGRAKNRRVEILLLR